MHLELFEAATLRLSVTGETGEAVRPGCALILAYSFIPLSRQTNLPTQGYDMSDQSGPSRFHALFETALQDYDRQTGIPLAKHPLAERLQNCQSAESVVALLQEQARDFCKFRGSDKVMKLLKSAVSALSTISGTTTLGQDFGLVRSRPH